MIKTNLILVLVTIALNVVIFDAGAQQNTQRSNVKLTVLNSMERTGQKQMLMGNAQAIIKAAKNEVESFQVIVHALEKNATVIKAEMSELTGKAGTISKDNATLFREEYTRVRISTPRATLPPGLYADPLVPFINPQTGKPVEPRSQTFETSTSTVITKGFEMYAVPFEIWKGENQPIWIDLSIPKNAAAGEYKGIFSITVYDGSLGEIPKNDGAMFVSRSKLNSNFETVYTIPVTLTVWDFALPDGPTHRSNFGPVLPRVATAFGLDKNSPEARELELNYAKMMAENRINPPIPTSLLPEMNEDGSLKISPERNQALKKFIDDLHVTDFPIPGTALRKMTATNREKVIRYYRQFYQYLKDNGWDKRAYLYTVDEPNTRESYDEVLFLGKVMREAAPEIPLLVVEQPYKQDPSYPALDSAVDIWCPLFSFINRDSINAKLAQGDEVWSYPALAQRAPSYNFHEYAKVKDYDPPYWAIDQPLTVYRMPTWMNWQYKITGLLYWTTVYNTTGTSGEMDPWYHPILSASGKHYAGEGYLMYPGKPAGINGPVASIRMKNIRDSMEDYEYFDILAKLSDRETVTRIVSTIVPNWWAKPEPKDFITVRERIANEIVKLKK